MKILLANPPWYNDEGEQKWLGVRAGSRWPHSHGFNESLIPPYLPFPFFLATATSLLKTNDFKDVKIVDSIASGQTYEEFYDIAFKYNPDVLVMETSTPSLFNDLKIAKKIKEEKNEIKIVFCGIHSEIEHVDFLRKHYFVDFTLYGEYEFPLLDLVKVLSNSGDFSTVSNLVYRNQDGEIIKNDRGTLCDLNDLPWPERDELPKTYLDNLVEDDIPQLQIHSARGCVFNCVFCAWPQFMYGGTKYRKRNPKDVVDEIVYNFKKYPYRNFFIDDDTFNISKEHVLELCRLIKENGLDKVRWSAMGRADLMDEEILLALKDAGIYSIKYGVESFDEKVLELANKKMNIKKNVENIILTKKLGIKVYLTFCLGLPGDTKKTIERTIEEALKLPYDGFQFSIATPYPGSEMYKMYDENGWINTYDWQKYDGRLKSVIETDELKASELEEYFKIAYAKLNEKLAISNISTEEFKSKLLNRALKKAGPKGKILVLQSAVVYMTKEIIKIISDLGYDVYVLSNEKFKNDFSNILSSEKIYTFKDTEFFNLECMKSQLIDLKKKNEFADVVIPYCNNISGYENVHEVAEFISDDKIGITLQGEIICNEE